MDLDFDCIADILRMYSTQTEEAVCDMITKLKIFKRGDGTVPEEAVGKLLEKEPYPAGLINRMESCRPTTPDH